MQFWLNKHSEKNNVVIQYENGLLLASCDNKSYDTVENQLQKNTNPLELFGKENLSLIPWKSIQEITSDTGDLDIEFRYKIKDEEMIKVSFGHAHSKEQCVSNIVGLFGDKFELSSNEYSAISFYLNPLLSLALALGSTLLFYEIFQNLALIIGALWALVSLVRLIKLSKKPKEINHWKVKSRSEKKPSLVIEAKKDKGKEAVTVYAYMGVACLIVAVYFGVSMFIKPAALNELTQAKNQSSNSLKKQQSAKLNNGGVGRESVGRTELIAAIVNSDEKLAISLINNGADLSKSHDGRTALDFAIDESLENVVLTLISNDAPSSNQQSLLPRAIENGLELNAIRKIVNAGADVNYKNDSGISVLATALESDARNNVIRYLLENGASTKIKVGSRSPVEFAKSNENKRLAALLSRY